MNRFGMLRPRKARRSAGFWWSREIRAMLVEERLLESVRLWPQSHSGFAKGQFRLDQSNGLSEEFRRQPKRRVRPRKLWLG
jgi:hypothetical protein